MTLLSSESAYYYFPYKMRVTDFNNRFLKAMDHIKNGGRIMLEITEGARKGSIGEIRPDIGWYLRNNGGDYFITKRIVELFFDDRKTSYKFQINWRNPHANMKVHFDKTETVWSYTTTPREIIPKRHIQDHFGSAVEIGDVCCFVDRSKNLRFGKVTRRTDLGTVFLEPFVTRENMGKEVEVSITPNEVKNLVKLDEDVRSKVMLAKLSLT